MARECVEDLVADGVVYAEVRYAPEQHVAGRADPRRGRRRGAGGLRRGHRGRRRPDRRAPAADRDAPPGPLAWRSPSSPSPGATGAWPASTSPAPRPGFPPTRHLDAFEYLQRENAHFTIHAGEAFGLPSIWQAIQWCGADRLGHGVRIIDDITVHDDGSVELGRLAAYVRDTRIPLEMCPASNIQTGAAASIAEHPIGLLTELAVPGDGQHRQPADEPDLDDRRDVSLVEAFGYGLDDLRWFTINAMKSAFLPFDERLDHRPGHQAGVRRAGGAERVTTARTDDPRHRPAAAALEPASSQLVAGEARAPARRRLVAGDDPSRAATASTTCRGVQRLPT